MKAILMSIKKKQLDRIVDGCKWIECRKTKPKDFKGWVYLYERKAGKGKGLITHRFFYDSDKMNTALWNIKIIGQEMFLCGKNMEFETTDIQRKLIYKGTGLTHDELKKYGKNEIIKLWFIDKLEETKPLKLEDVDVVKAPQSWCYIEI